MTTRTLTLDRCPTCDTLQEPPNRVCCCKSCGHALDDHSANLDCRICKAAGEYYRCGINCTTSMLRR